MFALSLAPLPQKTD